MPVIKRVRPAVYNLITKGGLDEIPADISDIESEVSVIQSDVSDIQTDVSTVQDDINFFSIRRVLWYRGLTNSSGVFTSTFNTSDFPKGVYPVVTYKDTPTYPITVLDLPPVADWSTGVSTSTLTVTCKKWDTVTIGSDTVVKSVPIATGIRTIQILLFDPNDTPDTIPNES